MKHLTSISRGLPALATTTPDKTTQKQQILTGVTAGLQSLLAGLGNLQRVALGNLLDKIYG